MLKVLSLITLLIIISVTLQATETTSWTETDTLEVFEDKVYVRMRTYKDSILTEDIQSYLYPTTIVFPKFRFFPYFFKEEVEADSVVYHGTVKIFDEKGNYRIGKYNNGRVLIMAYYDPSGRLITKDKYYEELRYIRGGGDPDKGYGIIRFWGTKED